MTVTEAAAALRPYDLHSTESSVRAVSGPPRQTLIRTRDLSYSYPSSARRVLDGVSLDVRSGELTAIAGANGAGKSTMARHLVRVLDPGPGAVWIDGQDAATLSMAELTRKVGYVFQYPEHQFIGRTLLDDVSFGLRRAGIGSAQAEQRAGAMLARFGLQRLAPASPFTLSHGEQRRLSVASMLVLGQRALLLDEPTFGQDRRNYEQLLDVLQSLADEGIAVAAITHDMRLVAERAARVVVLADGAVVFDGAPSALFADRKLVARARLKPPPLWQLSQALDFAVPLVRVADFVDLVSADRREPLKSV